MRELTVDTVRDYLIDCGQLRSDQPAVVEWLAGGVSNVVFRVSAAGQTPFVLKQSRTQLRTQADWFSRLDRIFREADAQRVLSESLPAGTVPTVLFEDRENYCYAMSAVRADHAVWKQQLLAGEVDHRTFERSGRLLGEIHARSASHPDRLPPFADTTVFFELRVDPFYRRIAAVHPRLQPSIDRMIAEMAAHPLCLVHADFSPKNILVHPDGISLVDYETVHLGDPAFDLGFFFSHLWLKAIALPESRMSIQQGIEAAWLAYQSALTAERSAAAVIHFAHLSQRAVSHLAACLLSRVDGKSTVDYLQQESQRRFVREVSCHWLLTPQANFDAAFNDMNELLATSDALASD